MGHDGEAQRICYGDYFLAARQFLIQQARQLPVTATTHRCAKEPQAVDLGEVAVFVAKHGQFYHPARIAVTASGIRRNFVLNVAVSREGLATIETEAATLRRLNRMYPKGFLPQVFAEGEVMADCGQILRMFLGEWFDGYSEFHLARKEQHATPRILVWDSAQSDRFLTAEETLELYRRMAFILTYYYNLQSFEQIGSWHHAAGDFVIKRRPEAPDVKLVSVRRYRCMFDLKPPGDQASLILNSLMLFLVDLMIRMRLDREDGTGDLIWSDDSAVYGSLLGFLEGLSAKGPIAELPDTPVVCFLSYLSACSREDITQLCRAVMDRYAAEPAALGLLMHQLPSHARQLYRAIQSVVA